MVVTVVVWSVCLCVCVSVFYNARCYIPHFLVSSRVSSGFSWHFQQLHFVDFAENTLFSSFGVICLQLLPSMLPDHRMDSNMVCTFSNSLYKTTTTSLTLFTAKYTVNFF